MGISEPSFEYVKSKSPSGLTSVEWRSKNYKPMKKEVIKFRRIFLQNRWRQPKYSRNGSWVPFGYQIWWAGPCDFCHKLCLFGIDISVWFKREFK